MRGSCVPCLLAVFLQQGLLTSAGDWRNPHFTQNKKVQGRVLIGLGWARLRFLNQSLRLRGEATIKRRAPVESHDKAVSGISRGLIQLSVGLCISKWQKLLAPCLLPARSCTPTPQLSKSRSWSLLSCWLHHSLGISQSYVPGPICDPGLPLKKSPAGGLMCCF